MTPAKPGLPERPGGKQGVLKKLKTASNLGVFRNCRTADDECNFKQLNLLYGFNGSGKTTLTRIFSSLEKGELCALLPAGGRFEIELYDGTLISNENNLGALKQNIAVFNTDFVEDNFQWKVGSAKPVFYIGKDQAETGKKLREAALKREPLETQKLASEQAKGKADRAFATFKTITGRAIGEAIADRNFNARNLDSEFARGDRDDSALLDEQGRKQLRTLILQDAPPPKVTELGALDGFREFAERSRACLSETVGTATLRELTDHPSMVGWVKAGQEYHRTNNLDDCLLCGNPFTPERMQALDAAIDDKFDRIAAETAYLAARGRDLQAQITAARTTIPSRNDLAGDQSAYDAGALAYKAALSDLGKALSLYEDALARKAQAPNTAVDLAACPDPAEATRFERACSEALSSINECIAIHNKAHDEFAQTQQDARSALLGHYLAEARDEYRRLESEAADADKQTTKDSDVFNKLVQQIEELSQQLRNHGPAAEAINALIKAYLRHGDIEIVAQDDGFQLRRHGHEIATNLSEGEKTAITLCYFLSSLGSDGRQIKDLIVIVDDPISSLDSKALNYAFSVLKGHVGAAKQLIILTHNVNFMNECRKWLKGKVDKGIAALLFLDLKSRDNARQSEITKLPKLLREYDSEYHYLFSLVLNFAEADGAENDYLFLMPNAMRKVADVFLAFKRPGNNGLADKVEALSREAEALGLDPSRLRAVDRLVQVESHGDNLDDLITFSSMTVEEAHESAQALMELVEKLDADHYERLCRQCR
ncbi:AAA family ATPase [Aquidulcibacter paucihalophilus]|uniref:AAA family ATPase n=1 Tax=Aquidulcibacter paucihalophilus TaxID=1978549 RepID=UPI0018E34802|nr:AAA family ATPase [Aquidulcibacter paucihalophilus]